MKRYEHLRRKARKFRRNGDSLGIICDRLKMSKTTVWYWVKDIPTKVTQKKSCKPHIGGTAIKRHFAKLREDAYKQGMREYRDLIKIPTFRDFVVTYIGEGYRRTRNQVAVANSNEKVIKLSYYWMKRLANPERPLDFGIQIHKDNNEGELKDFWAKKLGISPSSIKVIRKSNSGEMAFRKWRSQYGVFTVRVSDTYLRSRVQAWMGLVMKDWDNPGVA